MHRRDDVAPFIVEPVFVRQADRKIAPHRMMWPAFWGRMKGDAVTPLVPDVVKQSTQGVFGGKEAKLDEWKPLTEEQIAKGLEVLSAKKEDGESVYVCGG